MLIKVLKQARALYSGLGHDLNCSDNRPRLYDLTGCNQPISVKRIAVVGKL